MEGVRIFLVIIVFSVECHAMSNTELEDFKEFLEKTSALDHTLKDGFNHNEDEDETVSEHAWEESGKFEGDLILSDRQRHLIVEDVAEGLSRNGLNDITKRWPNNEVIYYIQREHFSGGQVQAIQDGIEDIGQSSCISFRPYKKGDRDAVVIQGSRRGCFSQVGYQGGYQVLNLSGRHPVGRGCFRHGTVVHELLHTLGFYHMQSSADRDDYIDVIWENIVERAKHNFRKYNSFAVTDFGVGYDYDSVLHYSKRAFTKNGKATLVPKQDSVSIGQRVGMSNKDKDKLNKMYCDKDSNNNNFEQNDDSIEQSDKKKQLTKTKPFKGHGIGYHQGKAVVIKLPTADTYSLPDLPSYHLYDYFSKVPETLAPAYPAAFGGQDDSYKIPIIESEYDGIYKSPPKAKHDKKYDKELKSTKKEEKPLNKDLNIENLNQPSENNNTKHDLELDAALDDAFDRLKKIIKTHVYPTRGVDVKPYKDDKESKSKNYYEDIERIKDKITKDTKSSVKSYDRPSIDTLTKIIKTHEYPIHEVNVKPYKEDKELLTKSKSYYEDLKIIKDKISTDTKSSDENDDLPKIDTLRQKIKTHIYPTHVVDVEPYEENKEIGFKNYYEDIERLKDKIAKETKSSDENVDRPRLNDSKGLLSHRLPKNVADFEDSMEKRLETILKSFGQHENIRKLSDESGYGDYYEPHSDSYRIHPTNEKITHGWHFNQEEPYESYYKPKKLLYK